MFNLDEIASAIGTGFRANGFGGLGYEAVWSQLKPWFGKISTNGVLKWLPKAATQMPCQVPEYDQGVPVGPCLHTALETCLCCQRPVCLHHAFVDSQGEAICYLCAVAMREQLGRGPRPEPPRAKQPPPPDPRQDAQARAWWARGVLGIQEGVSWADVKVQHRKLSAQYHPDRPGGDESKFKDIQKAFDLLKTVYGEN